MISIGVARRIASPFQNYSHVDDHTQDTVKYCFCFFIVIVVVVVVFVVLLFVNSTFDNFEFDTLIMKRGLNENRENTPMTEERKQ